MSIPFLAIALVKGVGSFVHMASHLGNVSQGAASQAAGDAVSGNYSFGNVSEGNQQIANTSMLSQSRAASYRAGAFQLVDGREDITTMGDGSQVINIATSNLPISLNNTETDSAQLSSMAAKSYQKALNLSKGSATSLADSYRNMVDLSENMTKSESMNDGVTQSISPEESRAIHAGANMIKEFSEQNGITTQKAADIFGELSFGGGLGNGATGLKGSVGGKTGISASDQQLLQKAERYAQDKNFQEATRHASQASKNIAHNLHDETGKRLAEGVSGSYEKGTQQREDAAKTWQEAESYNEQAINMRANASAISARYDQEFVDWLKNQQSDNTTGRLGHRGAADIIMRRPEEAIAWGNKFRAERGLIPNASLNTNADTRIPEKMRESYNADTRHKVYEAPSSSLDAVRAQIPPEFNHPFSSEGVVRGEYASPTIAPFARNLDTRGEKLRDDTINTIEDTQRKIEAQSTSIKQRGTKVEQKVKEEEGRSVVGRAFRELGSEIVDTAVDIRKKILGEPEQK